MSETLADLGEAELLRRLADGETIPDDDEPQ